jgi:predicted NBD/HSP70 family sugar kinase
MEAQHMRDNSPIRGSNHQSTRIQNRAIVLKIICTGTNVSRIDMSRQTGLSKMSITNIVNELIDEAYVTDQAGQLKNDSIGRNPISLKPDLNVHRVLGIYISRDYVVATLSNLKCEILSEFKCILSYDESENTFIEKIKTLTAGILNSDKAVRKKIIGIGISCIGPLDIENGIILEPPNFHKIRSIHIKELLEKEFGYEVHINNDMNASALAEKLYGKGRNISNFVYIGVTNGIGSGIIANNALFEGAMGFSGEIGHTTINFDGPKCACGNTGCLELYASIPEIVAQARSSVSLGMDSTLGRPENIEWQDIIKHARTNDKLSLNLIDRLCLYISIGLVSLVNMFDPQVIYLGHDIALADDLVTGRLENYIKGKTISSSYKDIPIEISAFADKAPLLGSIAIVLDKLFQ